MFRLHTYVTLAGSLSPCASTVSHVESSHRQWAVMIPSPMAYTVTCFTCAVCLIDRLGLVSWEPWQSWPCVVVHHSHHAHAHLVRNHRRIDYGISSWRIIWPYWTPITTVLIRIKSRLVNGSVIRDFPRNTGVWRKCSVLTPYYGDF